MATGVHSAELPRQGPAEHLLDVPVQRAVDCHVVAGPVAGAKRVRIPAATGIAALKREDLVAGYARRLAARRGGACLGDAGQRAAHMAGMSIARPGTP